MNVSNLIRSKRNPIFALLLSTLRLEYAQLGSDITPTSDFWDKRTQEYWKADAPQEKGVGVLLEPISWVGVAFLSGRICTWLPFLCTESSALAYVILFIIFWPQLCLLFLYKGKDLQGSKLGLRWWQDVNLALPCLPPFPSDLLFCHPPFPFLLSLVLPVSIFCVPALAR